VELVRWAGRTEFRCGHQGFTQYGKIRNCYATGAVLGSSAVGGLAAGIYDGAEVTNCYSTGLVSGTGQVGGLLGLVSNISGACTVTSSYWDSQTSGQPGSAGGTGKTTVQMKQQATFAGWDFIRVWGISEGVTYPILATIQQPPLAPVNSSPANGATGVALAPMLRATGFNDINTTTRMRPANGRCAPRPVPAVGR